MTRDEAAVFAGRLLGLATEESRADRALLKRARTGHPTQQLLARRVVHGLVPPGVAHSPRTLDLVERVVGLFVVLPDHRDGAGSVGACARRLADRKGVSRDAVERRFTAILSSSSEAVATHIARLFARCASENVGIDYGQLTYDLERAGHPDRWIERRWADEFWGTDGRSAASENETETTEEGQ